jgi:pyridoxine 5-phosphate synthase
MLVATVRRLKASGMRVSLFLDADPAMVATAAATGADRIELYTGPYGHTFEPAEKALHLDALAATAEAARAAGLGINAGHDLTLDNLPPLVARIPTIDEVSIGHALTADALMYGMAETVRRYVAACGDRG